MKHACGDTECIHKLRKEYQRWIDYSVNRCIENGAAAETVTLRKEWPGEFAPTIIEVEGEPIARVVVTTWKEHDGYRAQVDVQERVWE